MIIQWVENKRLEQMLLRLSYYKQQLTALRQRESNINKRQICRPPDLLIQFKFFFCFFHFLLVKLTLYSFWLAN